MIDNCVQRAGLAAVLEFITSSPELKTNRITDDEDKDKCSIELRLIEPLADSQQKDEDLFVSQHSSKPNVVRWPSIQSCEIVHMDCHTGKKWKLPYKNYRLIFLKTICPQENNAESK